MTFSAISLIVITALMLIIGAKSKRKSLFRWGMVSLIVLLVLIIPSFINGFIEGFSEGWSAR